MRPGILARYEDVLRAHVASAASATATQNVFVQLRKVAMKTSRREQKGERRTPSSSCAR